MGEMECVLGQGGGALQDARGCVCGSGKQADARFAVQAACM